MLTSSFISKIAGAGAIAVIARTAMTLMLDQSAAAARATSAVTVAGRSAASHTRKATNPPTGPELL